MPMELKLAKPQSAKVAMAKERGSSTAFCPPSMVKATNSFNTMRVPSRLPIAMQSCHGTPMIKAMGAKRTPRIFSRLAGNQAMPCAAKKLCAPPSNEFMRKMMARNEISMAATFSAKPNPSLVPLAAASSTLLARSSSGNFAPPAVSGTSVSGTSILATGRVPGAVMITAASRCSGATPTAM